ncbi:hypothetical protein Tco_1096678, partial [Tanacetum coccineum]
HAGKTNVITAENISALTYGGSFETAQERIANLGGSFESF